MIPTESPVSFKIPVFEVNQPIGPFYIGVIDSKRLCDITEFDIRRLLREREFEKYLGIQRPLDNSRVKEIKQYVNTVDACFPTAVILSVRAECVEYDPSKHELTLKNYMDSEDPERNVLYKNIAKVIDGQHRIEGLKGYEGNAFGVNVSIFVDIDVAQEGYIFSTVNLAQTKVNRSLAVDLVDLAKARSPQKFCHNAAVALDGQEGSPLYHRIKRLGVATAGRLNETITQATFVDSLMQYISRDPMKDRDIYLRKGIPLKASKEESKKLLFRNMFIDNRDLEIVDILWNYFSAVRECWPSAWASNERGVILNKTNGFRALMRFLGVAYPSIVKTVGDVPTQAQFAQIFQGMALGDGEFTTKTFDPGSSGEAAMFKMFKEHSKLS